MPTSITKMMCVSVVVAISGGQADGATPYDQPAERAVSWLTSRIHPLDGSWGAGSVRELDYVATTEAVVALRAWGHLDDTYYRALSWIELHAPTNADLRSRRLLALHASGSSRSCP